jgi:hypothetical protein
MVIEFEKNHTSINMMNYIKESLETYGKKVRKANTPAKLDMYDV